MKKLILGIMLIAGLTFAQTGSKTCNTDTALDSAGVFTAAYEGPLTGYNSIGLTVYADVSSAASGVVLEYAVKLSTGAYRVIKRYSYSYTGGDIGFTKYMPVDAPYMRVIYTNGTTAQTTFSLFVMKHGESNSPTTTDGKVDIVGATSNGNLEATQLVLLGYQHPATINLGAATTVSTETDTTTFTSTVWQTFGVFALDDSLQISLDGSFTNAIPVYPYTQFTFDKFSPVTYPKGYIRRLGGTGTVNYVPIIKGY